MGDTTYTWFEIEMCGLFSRFYGMKTGTYEEEVYWKDVQRLKKMAQDELLMEVSQTRAEPANDENIV